MLTDSLKQSIQQCYRTLLENKGYRARFGQRQMIAEIVKTLANIKTNDKGIRVGESHICAVEAGTGTGKTIAYLVAALPVALEHNKKLIISTATILLQEQLVQKDLPDLLRYGGLPFSFALAKGRGRYLCLSKLENTLSMQRSLNPERALFEDEKQDKLDKRSAKKLEKLHLSFTNREWDGDRDRLTKPVDNALWQKVTTDHNQCTNRRCSNFSTCGYFLAKQDIADADIVVANHDLVLADQALGGGALLPAPSESIYIFDEAHHLPDKALNHFSHHFRINTSKQWLAQIPKIFTQTIAQLGYQSGLDEQLDQLPKTLSMMTDNLGFMREIITPMFDEKGSETVDLWRFARGQIPEEIQVIAKNLTQLFSQLSLSLEQVLNELNDKIKQEVSESKQVIEQFYGRISVLHSRSVSAQALWHSYTGIKDKTSMPVARWIQMIDLPGQLDFDVWSSPVLASELLMELLWQRCHGAVLTSATLTAMNDFNRIHTRMGLPQDTAYRTVPSPFNYRQSATFEVPATAVDPREGAAFEISLVEQLNQLIDPKGATLVLFTARSQMRAVQEKLNPALKAIIISQDETTKQDLVRRHCKRIDSGSGSVIFGLSSLTEGIDLPGKYVQHVIIAKLPFAVPDDPIEATLNEWLKSQGRNPFWEISVPDTTIRLKQACGRLLRSEQDVGRITLLDRRIVTKSYGKAMLDALPDFRRVIG